MPTTRHTICQRPEQRLRSTRDVRRVLQARGLQRPHPTCQRVDQLEGAGVSTLPDEGDPGKGSLHSCPSRLVPLLPDQDL